MVEVLPPKGGIKVVHTTNVLISKIIQIYMSCVMASRTNIILHPSMFKDWASEVLKILESVPKEEWNEYVGGDFYDATLMLIDLIASAEKFPDRVRTQYLVQMIETYLANYSGRILEKYLRY